ncbi:MAG: GxxExxY protein, partial [bacterium]
MRACIYDVHNKLGVGYDEQAYHLGMVRRFHEESVPFISKERKNLLHRATLMKSFELDFLVFDKIIISLKCIRSDFIQSNYVQIISELKLWKKHLGLLVNFGLPKVNIRRIPFTEKQKVQYEDYSHVKDRMNNFEHLLVLKLREAVLFVFQCHGLGYGKSIYQKLIEAELTYRKIKFRTYTPIEVKYDDEVIRNFKMKFLLVEEKVILGVIALQREFNYEIIKMQTYL